MNSFTPVFLPVGVPTFHMESANAAFESTKELLRSLDENFVMPGSILLSAAEVAAFLRDLSPDLVVFENTTFANAAYMSEVLRVYDGPMVLYTVREPSSGGGRLKLNSLTGAYSAANALRGFGGRPFTYVFGSPEEDRVKREIGSALLAAKVKKEAKSLKLAAIGHTPQGFGFGRALDAELMNTFGAELVAIEARELIRKAEAYPAEEIAECLENTEKATVGFASTPEKNRIGHARLLKAYRDFIRENGIGALASRCWPDFFTDFGTPVCTVLSMLNDEGVSAACEADVYGALSMWFGGKLSGEPVFFGDPVSLSEEENSVTFWHCGAAACSLARRDTGAVVGVHPNRKIGPAMDFGCEAAGDATIFRIGREPDGSFRFFIAEGTVLDKPKQFIGTSIVVRTDADARAMVEDSVLSGFEPHFAVIRGRHGETLRNLASMYGFPVYEY